MHLDVHLWLWLWDSDALHATGLPEMRSKVGLPTYYTEDGDYPAFGGYSRLSWTRANEQHGTSSYIYLSGPYLVSKLVGLIRGFVAMRALIHPGACVSTC